MKPIKRPIAVYSLLAGLVMVMIRINLSFAQTGGGTPQPFPKIFNKKNGNDLIIKTECVQIHYPYHKYSFVNLHWRIGTTTLFLHDDVDSALIPVMKDTTFLFANFFSSDTPFVAVTLLIPEKTQAQCKTVLKSQQFDFDALDGMIKQGWIHCVDLSRAQPILPKPLPELHNQRADAGLMTQLRNIEKHPQLKYHIAYMVRVLAGEKPQDSDRCHFVLMKGQQFKPIARDGTIILNNVFTASAARERGYSLLLPETSVRFLKDRFAAHATFPFRAFDSVLRAGLVHRVDVTQ